MFKALAQLLAFLDGATQSQESVQPAEPYSVVMSQDGGAGLAQPAQQAAAQLVTVLGGGRANFSSPELLTAAHQLARAAVDAAVASGGLLAGDVLGELPLEKLQASLFY